jgi:addiction module HigA family antidote
MIDMIELQNVDSSMIANNLTAFEPTHPGRLIREELEEREMTQAKLAERIGVSSSLLNEVINGKRAVNTELALLLEAALGIAAHIWLDLQAKYNMHMVSSDASFMDRLAKIRRVAAVF